MASERYQRTVEAIDRANADDPTLVELDGERVPEQVAHARLMTRWVLDLQPDASEVQLVAARAHHLRRWQLPRSDHPEGRAGYLRWRTAQKARHAEEVAQIMGPLGWSGEEVEAVGRIVRKEGLGRDSAVQVHEDALCLVFLGTQFDDLAERLGDDHMVEVLVRTIRKMSPAGISRAAVLPLSDRGQALLGRAVDQVGASGGSGAGGAP